MVELATYLSIVRGDGGRAVCRRARAFTHTNEKLENYFFNYL